MARPLRIQFPGAFYHITCRGIERRRIYADTRDRYKFLALLSDSLDTYQAVLYAYIMLSNHFHLLIQTRKANCSEFMRHFNICYTGWFNWRHNRCGNLYQGRYQAFLIDADNYLLEVSRYLHLNNVRVKGMRALDYRQKWCYARDYQWSSLAGYVSLRHAVRAVDYALILSMVGGRRAYRDFVLDGLKRDIESPFKKVRSRIILGDDDFAKEVKQYLKRGSRREQPSYRDLTMSVLAPEVFLGILRRECGITEKLLQQRGANGVLRGIVAELLYKYCEITQSQIGNLLGRIDYVSVHQLRRRMRKKMLDNEKVRQRYNSIEAKIKQSCIM
jgi:putative transposase